MKLSWKQVLSAASLGLASLAAHAGNVQWSIGINLPPVATVISGGPGYHHGPVGYPVAPYHAPPVAAYPPYYAPPVHYVPPRAVYRPAPIFYAPPPVVYRHGPRYHPPAVVVDRRWGKPKGHWDRPGHGYRGDDYRSGYRGDYRGPRGGRDDDRGDRRYRPGRD